MAHDTRVQRWTFGTLAQMKKLSYAIAYVWKRGYMFITNENGNLRSTRAWNGFDFIFVLCSKIKILSN